MVLDNVLQLERLKQTHSYRLCVPLDRETHTSLAAGGGIEKVTFKHDNTLVYMFKTFEDLQRFIMSSKVYAEL